MSSSELHRVSQKELITVNQWLERHLPHSWKIYGTSREIVSGRWSGHVFYTLGWPEIRGVVEKPDLDSNDNPCTPFYKHQRYTAFYAPDPKDNEEILQRHTDWSKPFLFLGLDDAGASAAMRVAKEEDVDRHVDVRVIMMQADPGDIVARPVPEGYKLRRVEPETDPSHCAPTWIFQCPDNVAYFKSLSKRLPSACLVNSNDECVSFEFGTEYGNVGMLYTRGDHRRRGLARVVVSNLVQEYFKEGLPAVAWVDVINEPSIKMHESLGFKRVCMLHLIICLPKDVQDKDNDVLVHMVQKLAS